MQLQQQRDGRDERRDGEDRDGERGLFEDREARVRDVVEEC